jgi:hypothetical protein
LESRRKFLTDAKTDLGLTVEDLSTEENLLATIEKLALANREKDKKLKNK